MYKAANGEEITVDLNSTDTEYIVGTLNSSTSYVVSVLAYTNGGYGPRSIHLTATTNNKDICKFFTSFPPST